VAALGLALTVGAPVVWQATRPATDVGDVSLPPIAPQRPAPTSPAPAAADPADPPRVTRGLAALRVPAAAAPVGVTIARVDMDAPVIPVGVADDGQMEVPDDVTTVGWYRFGATPGGEGSAVLAGHVDSRTQGVGAFYDLIEVMPGDRVTVLYEDGTRRRFEVTGRRQIAKAQVPLERVFARAGPPRLVLITCGGSFDPGSRSYDSNVVVTAVPLGERDQ
jgi:hypothetical protein